MPEEAAPKFALLVVSEATGAAAGAVVTWSVFFLAELQFTENKLSERIAAIAESLVIFFMIKFPYR